MSEEQVNVVKLGDEEFPLKEMRGKKGRTDMMRVLDAVQYLDLAGERAFITPGNWGKIESILPILFCCKQIELEPFTFADIIAGIPAALDFHLSGLSTPEVEEALKNLDTGEETVEE